MQNSLDYLQDSFTEAFIREEKARLEREVAELQRQLDEIASYDPTTRKMINRMSRD
jgi:hypothetical protein